MFSQIDSSNVYVELGRFYNTSNRNDKYLLLYYSLYYVSIVHQNK